MTDEQEALNLLATETVVTETAKTTNDEAVVKTASDVPTIKVSPPIVDGKPLDRYVPEEGEQIDSDLPPAKLARTSPAEIQEIDPSLPMQPTTKLLTVEQQDFNNRYTMSNLLYKSKCAPKCYQNPLQVMYAIQAGHEMGMQPVESLNTLYIVNGQVTLWGVGLAKRLRQFGYEIFFEDGENIDGCIAKIKKDGVEHEYHAKMAEVQKMSKQAYKFAPRDKARWHALSRLVRFSAPEVLGSISYTGEEIEDAPSMKTHRRNNSVKKLD